ncbi:MAG: mandelate racemase/muconate lactonizing enzyme family protein [Dehalococcoidia bacterium]
MKITDITVNLLTTGRTLVRVFTDEGVNGIADGGRSLAVTQAYLDEIVKPMLVGKDALQPTRHWEALTLGDGEHATRLPPQIVGSIDIALWDIMGKAANMPLSSLMGGAARTDIPLYWSQGNGWKKTPEQMLSDVQRGYEQGFKFFKVRMDWRDYRQDADPEKDFQIFKTVREWLPDDCPLGFDANNAYSVSTAIMQGKRLQDLGCAHFEEPLPQYDLPGLKQVVDALDVPISTGEQETSRWRFRDLIDQANPDILQPDILNVGGISEVKRVYEVAVIRNKPVMPHSPVAGINSAASLHAYSTVGNAIRPHEFSDEFSGDLDQIASLFKDPIMPEDGRIQLPDRPGLGLELNEAILAKAIVG